MAIEVRLEQLQRCSCGAVLVEIDGIEYGCRPKYFNQHFEIVNGSLRLQRILRYCCCNYCANNWGLDLCGCGSGEPFGKCSNMYKECRMPSQSIENARQFVRAGDSWI